MQYQMIGGWYNPCPNKKVSENVSETAAPTPTTKPAKKHTAKVKLPANVEQLWHFRPALLGVLCVVTLLFLMAQWASGFGLQRAIQSKIEADFAESKAAANTPEKLQRWEMRVDAAKGYYHVRTTAWLRLAVLLHLLAAASVAIEAGLTFRGNKPLPRLAAMW